MTNSGQNSDSGLVLINNDHASSTTKKWSIKLVVTIIADMTNDVKTDSTSPNSPEATFRMNSNTRASWDESCLPQNKILPSDTMLVLQEVRNDDHEPLMFVMQLKDTAHLPMVSKPFSIPFDRLSSKGPLVFWLRLFTKSSVYVNISSNVKVHTDLAEKIWRDSLGYHAVVREGDAGVTVDDTEQLLFRVPLDFEVKENTAAPVEGESSSDKGDVDGLNKDGLVSSRSDQSLVPRVIVYLFVSDPAIERLLHVLLVTTRKSDQSADMMEIPNPLGLIIPITSLQGFINNLVAFTVPPKEAQIPKFHWKLVLLSKEALLEPQKPVLEYPISQRYAGKYIANNKLRLFRDVYSVEKSSFPLALKLSVNNMDETNLSHNAIILRAFKKSDGNLIAEFDANDINKFSLLLFEKTLGYSDNLENFLNNLEKENVVAFNPSTLKWNIEWHRLIAKNINTNVADFLITKLSNSLESDHEFLYYTAIIGNIFPLKLLYHIYRDRLQLLKLSLIEYLNEGIIHQTHPEFKLFPFLQMLDDKRFKIR
jgi:hypothetical protein